MNELQTWSTKQDDPKKIEYQFRKLVINRSMKIRLNSNNIIDIWFTACILNIDSFVEIPAGTQAAVKN